MNLDDIKRQTQAPSSFLMQREYNARTKLVLQQFDLVVSCIVPRAALRVCRVVLAFRRLSPCHCICTHHISCLLVCFVRGPGPLCRAEASCWVSCLRRCPFAPRTAPDQSTLNLEETRHASRKAPFASRAFLYYYSDQ